MAATHAVFDTYELIEHIISYLPTVDITKVTRVAKAWKTIITESPRLHDLRIPVPSTHYPVMVDRRCVSVMYDIGFKVTIVAKALNDITRETNRFCYSNDRHRVSEISSGSFDLPQDHLMFPTHFITTPPCQAVSILATTYTNICAVVKARNGVTFGDVKAAAEKMRESDIRYGGFDGRSDMKFIVWVDSFDEP